MGTKLRVGGLVAGAAGAAVLLAGWAVPAGTVVPPAHVTLSVEPSADVALTPMGENVARATLSAGAGRLSRRIDLRNATGEPRSVRLRLTSREHGLDEVLAVRLASDGRVLYAGPLSRLRSSAPVRLAPRETAQLEVTARLAGDVSGRVDALRLEVVSR
jgi:hypothetical protein